MTDLSRRTRRSCLDRLVPGEEGESGERQFGQLEPGPGETVRAVRGRTGRDSSGG